MSASFDAYRSNYEAVVQDSIAFSGIEHDFFLRAKVARLAELFTERFGTDRPRLLDIGCGVGRMHDHLMPIVRNLSGCDVSGEAVDRARQEHPWADYRQIGDGTLPWNDDSFDVSLAVCVMHHVPPANWPAFIADMCRVTRKGGLVVLIEHNPWNPATRLAVARCPFDHDAVLLGARRAEDLLRRRGAQAVESRHFLVLPSLASWAGRIERLLRRLPIGAQYLTVGEV